MKKLIFFILIISNLSALSAKKKCLIAINTSDCSLCLTSYKFINKVNKDLNPILILSQTDKSAAEYFVRDYLNVKEIPYIVDDSSYKNLVIDQFNLQLKLYDDSVLLYQIPVKELASKIDDLNSYSIQTETPIKPFSIQNFSQINKVLQKKFWGNTSRFIIDEYLTLYSPLTKWMLLSNLKLNKTDSIQFTDSLLMEYSYTKEELTAIRTKRDYYQKNIEGLSESTINGFAYYNEKIYLFYYILDYSKLKSKEELEKSNNEVVLHYSFFLIEINAKDGKYAKNRILNMTDVNYNSKISYRFNVAENQPALFLKSKEIVEYIILNQEWKRKKSNQTLPQLMAKTFAENIYFNDYTHNYDQNILIDNLTKKYVKINPKTLDDGIMSGASMLVYKNKVYFNVLSRQDDKHWVYVVDPATQKTEILKTYTELNSFSFFPIFYLEKSTNILYVLDINDSKQFYVVDSIKI